LAESVAYAAVEHSDCRFLSDSGATLFFFFEQKTAYEITTGDWSSDVCSSDLGDDGGRRHLETRKRVDADRHQDVVHHRGQRGRRHLPLEAQREVDGADDGVHIDGG